MNKRSSFLESHESNWWEIKEYEKNKLKKVENKIENELPDYILIEKKKYNKLLKKVKK